MARPSTATNCSDDPPDLSAHWQRTAAAKTSAYLRESIRDPHATVIDHQEAFAGICCVSAPVWWPNGRCAAALTALVPLATPPPALPDLVSRTAHRIAARLAVTQPAHALSRACTRGPDATRPLPRHSDPQRQVISPGMVAPKALEKMSGAITASARTYECGQGVAAAT